MAINTKRLRSDSKYWAGIAPEGATHYNKITESFYKVIGQCVEYTSCKTGVRWERSNCSATEVVGTHFIPRPCNIEKFIISDLPPVGCECEIYPYFHKCFIVCEYMDGVIVHNIHANNFFHGRPGEFKFRLICTDPNNNIS